MKKVINILAFIVLVLLIGIFPVCAENSGVEQSQVIQINKTNFPDENFRIYVGNLVGTENGYCTENGINIVHSFYIIESSIHSIEGIEFFTEFICFSK
mgnify:CR=1 FL=1